MKTNKTQGFLVRKLKFLKTALLLLLTTAVSVAQSLPAQSYIRIDQFGYLPNEKKVAVIIKSTGGFNNSAGIELNTGADVELRKVSDNSVVFSAKATAWNNGGEYANSKDRGWHFDFSSYKTAGEYYIRCSRSGGGTQDSYKFKIDNNVYSNVLKAAMNFFYYQRANFDKVKGYAQGDSWVDGKWYTQDATAKDVNGANAKDLSGGWIDAGDPNKYTDFAVTAVHNLLSTYEDYPTFWKKFNLSIPESSNDKPDILDEVKYEIDWLKKMQTSNGAFIMKMGLKSDQFNTNGVPELPSNDKRERNYSVTCPHSTIIGCGMLAHAAVIMKGISGWETYADGLKTQAANAWTNYVNDGDKAKKCDNQGIQAGNGNGPGDQYSNEHIQEAVCSAIYMFALTGESKYHDYIKANYRNSRPWNAGEFGSEWAFYRGNQGQALMYYTKLSNADSTVKTAILNLRQSDAKSKNGIWYPSTSLYKYDMVVNNYGSNNIISQHAADAMDLLVNNLRTADHDKLKEKALSAINFMHGTNPMGVCFLTNMYGLGGDLCADEMWHTWFDVNTTYDNVSRDCGHVGPAPGFLTGGINQYGSGNLKVKVGSTQFESLVKDQPNEKKFSNKNATEKNACPAEESSYSYSTPWEYNEPGIYYQASYVKALANFVARYAEDTPVVVVPAKGVTVSPATVSMESGLNQQLTATVTPTDAADKSVKWTTSNASIATVNANGLVTSLSQGTVTITATTTSGSFTASSTITVAAHKPNVSCGLINNTSFDNNFVGWDITNNNGYASITSDAKTGTKAVVISGQGGVNRSASRAVTEGYQITLTAFAKIEGTPSAAMIGIDYLNSSGTKLGNDLVNITATTYTNITSSKVPPIGTTKVLIWTFKNGGGKLFFDDVCLSQTDICGLVTNPGFETNFRNWDNAAGNAVIVTTGQNSWNKAAAIEKKGGLNRSANIAVTAGKKIDFSVIAKIEGSPTNTMVGLDYLDANGVKKGNKILIIDSTSYKTYTISETPPAGTTQVLIWSYKGSDAGKMFLDDLCMSNSTAARDAESENAYDSLESNALAIYPNPAKDYVKIPVFDATQSMELNVINASGTTLINKTINNVSGQEDQELNVNVLSPGVYIMKVKQGGVEKVQKLVKE
jgi:endoglucanase